MNQQDMINALTSALQQQDSNGQYYNVTLVLQTAIINSLPNLTITQLQNMCTILGINTGS
jgi:hypothetical protein